MFLSNILLDSKFPTWTIIDTKLYDWWIRGIKMVPNVLLAIIFLILFFLLAKISKKAIYRLVTHLSKSTSIGMLLSKIINIIIITLGLYIALNILKLDKVAISLLAGAGIVGLTLAFAFQDLTSNFISGVYIDFNKPFKIGDVIKSGDITGKVESIGLRSTSIHTAEGLHILMPNKTIFQNPITNYSKERRKQITINFTMSIQDDLNKIERIIIEAVKLVKDVNVREAINLYFTDIDQNNLKVSVIFWCNQDTLQDMMRIKHNAILAILKELKGHDIQRLK